MNTIFYLAYGSNLHPLRLRERIPSSYLMGTLELIGYRLMFHKLSPDKSGKCNIMQTNNDYDRVFGALFSMAASDKQALDRYEDDGDGYRGERINVSWQGDEYTCLTYIAEPTHIDDSLLPYDWYRSLVILGAEYLNLPQNYIHKLRQVKSINDPDEERRFEHEILVGKLLEANHLPQKKGKLSVADKEREYDIEFVNQK